MKVCLVFIAYILLFVENPMRYTIFWTVISNRKPLGHFIAMPWNSMLQVVLRYALRSLQEIFIDGWV